MNPWLFEGLAEERRLKLADDVRRARRRDERRPRRLVGLIKSILLPIR